MSDLIPIKDFRDGSAYQPSKSTNAWRWEFLRRDTDYQTFYAQHKNDDIRIINVSRFGVRCLYNPQMDDAYTHMLAPSAVVRLPTFEDLEKWEKVPGYTPERGLQMIMSTLTEMQMRGDTLAVINRALPIGPQLEQLKQCVEIKNDLDGDNPAVARERHAAWLSYLRILDGFAAGASADEIAAAIWPDLDNEYPDYVGRKRVIAAHKQAQHLCKTFAAKQFDSEK